MSIYYLVASLPLLHFEDKPPISMQDFLKECERWLSVGEYKVVQQALASDQGRTKQNTLCLWQAFKNSLKNEEIWLRANELNIDPQEYLRAGRQDAEPAVIDALAAALRAPDPLMAEKTLDRLMWQKIDELQTQHYFDIDQVIAYGLKLKILERYAQIATPQGQGKFEELKAAAALRY